MKIAVVGAGFCGVAACCELLGIKGVSVDLFDAKGLGGGASGCAAGLLHPCPGEQGRRSWMADAGMQATLDLVAVSEKALGVSVADRSGILRIGAIDKLYPDIVFQGKDTYLITSGVTIYPELYLEGLWKHCQEKGARLVLTQIDSLSQLEGYDKIILTVGAGIFGFEECGHLKLGKTKGQALVCKLPEGVARFERSIVAKGYIATGSAPDHFYVGSTYERDTVSFKPNLEAALADLQPKVDLIAPHLGPLNVLECRAGVRVSPIGHYIPLLEKINGRCYAITGMGSRGLLYHAYFAKLLKEQLLINATIV
ncbi:MAG: FAD-dependent oxidoreductase [Chlamydiota bacterium]